MNPGYRAFFLTGNRFLATYDLVQVKNGKIFFKIKNILYLRAAPFIN